MSKITFTKYLDIIDQDFVRIKCFILILNSFKCFPKFQVVKITHRDEEYIKCGLSNPFVQTCSKFCPFLRKYLV